MYPFVSTVQFFPWNDHHRFTCINIYQYNRIAMNSLNIGWKYWELSQLISNWGWVQIEVITIFNSSLGNWFWLLRRRGISLTLPHTIQKGVRSRDQERSDFGIHYHSHNCTFEYQHAIRYKTVKNQFKMRNTNLDYKIEA